MGLSEWTIAARRPRLGHRSDVAEFPLTFSGSGAAMAT